MICKGCGEDKPLTGKYFRKHPQCRSGFTGKCRVCINLQRKEKKSKTEYFYNIEYKGENKTGKIKSDNKDKALRVMNIRFRGCTINKLCTFKYKNKEVVRARKGNKK